MTTATTAAAPTVAVIAGTGFSRLAPLADPQPVTLDSAYGSVPATRGSWHGRATVFVPRHGPGHTVPPHRINYRGIIAGLRAAGVGEILAVNVVGGIGPLPGDLVVVSDFLDFTRSRPATFFDGTLLPGPGSDPAAVQPDPAGVVHTDMSTPYDAGLRGQLCAAAAQRGIPIIDGGIYACFEGPRFETPAEIAMAGAAGATVVGMTGVPEVVLAAEAGLRYASVCIVANPAAGRGSGPISLAEVTAVVAAGAARVVELLDATLARLAGNPGVGPR